MKRELLLASGATLTVPSSSAVPCAVPCAGSGACAAGVGVGVGVGASE